MHKTHQCSALEQVNTFHISVHKFFKIAGHVARMGQEELHAGFWWGNQREGDTFEDPGVDGKIILTLIFENCYGGLDLIDLPRDGEDGRLFWVV
jgi:hypothetical protein